MLEGFFKQMYNLLLSQDILSYFFWGVIGSFAMTLFLKVNEDIAELPKRHRLVKGRLQNVAFLIFEIIVNSFVGGLVALIINHNYAFALVSGFFSHFIVLYLVKWIKSANFKIAFNEVIGAMLKDVLKRVLLTLENNGTDKDKDKDN